jgi:hypothetical protein
MRYTSLRFEKRWALRVPREFLPADTPATAFAVMAPKSTSSRREIWIVLPVPPGTRYSILISEEGRLHIRPAGPDVEFGDPIASRTDDSQPFALGEVLAHLTANFQPYDDRD